MAKNKVSFETEEVRRQFAASKSVSNGRFSKIILAALCIVVVLAGAVYAAKLFSNKEVDWEAYGEALAKLEEKYDDHDKVILVVGGNEIKKSEYYKIKILNKFTFDSLMELYEEYIDDFGSTMNKDEIEALKPVPVKDEDIINDLILLEIGYLEAIKCGVAYNSETAYSKMNTTYYAYQEVLTTNSEEEEVYRKAKEFLDQAAAVAKGMGVTRDDYIRYLAEDSIKSLSVTELESDWQEAFTDSDYEGSVEEYIDERYEALKQLYSVEIRGLD